MKRFLKSITVILVLTFALTCFSMNAFASETTPEIGDVNSDGEIDATDALLVLKQVVKIGTVDITLADVSRNGEIDATDALWILKYTVRLIPDLSLETINATPKPTSNPVQENRTKLKNYVQTNGYTEDNVSIISYEIDGPLQAYIGYFADTDSLVVGIVYSEQMGDSTSFYVETYMPITGKNTESVYRAEYLDGNYYEFLEATAPINLGSITYDSTLNYTVTESENISASDIPEILDSASLTTTSGFLIWNEILTEELGFGLKGLGFKNL